MCAAAAAKWVRKRCGGMWQEGHMEETLSDSRWFYWTSTIYRWFSNLTHPFIVIHWIYGTFFHCLVWWRQSNYHFFEIFWYITILYIYIYHYIKMIIIYIYIDIYFVVTIIFGDVSRSFSTNARIIHRACSHQATNRHGRGTKTTCAIEWWFQWTYIYIYVLDDPSAIAITSQSWVADWKQWWRQIKHDKNTIQPKAP